MVGNEGAVLAYVKAGIVERHWAVASDDDVALEGLVEALREESQVPVTLLANVLEQTYRQETVPRVSILDRQKALKRKLQLVFPTHDMKAAMSLGDKPGAKGERRYLFAALPSSPELERWTK